jgi:hypothetical protein
MQRYKCALLLTFCFILTAPSVLSGQSQREGIITGELKKWHKVTLTFTGTQTGENAEPNPFLDYRLSVTFTKDNKRYVVPGYYAADDNAGQTSATAGNKWRVHFVPDEIGKWSYTASFRTGANIALSNESGSATAFDGVKGTFSIAATDKKGRDHRAKGLLQYVGKRYLLFAETGEFFLATLISIIHTTPAN